MSIRIVHDSFKLCLSLSSWLWRGHWCPLRRHGDTLLCGEAHELEHVYALPPWLSRRGSGGGAGCINGTYDIAHPVLPRLYHRALLASNRCTTVWNSTAWNRVDHELHPICDEIVVLRGVFNLR